MPWRPLDIPDEEVETFTRRFKERARFFLDECTEPLVSDVLRRLGYGVRTSAECGMGRRDDADPAALCWREGMILVTKDRDFLDPRSLPDHRNPGVVVLDFGAATEEQIIRAVYFLGILVGPFGRHWRQTRLVISHTGEVSVWVRNHDTGATEKLRFRLLPHRKPEMWIDE